MTRTLMTLAAAASLAAAAVAIPTQSEARCFGCAVGLGVLGGVVAGAAIAGAASAYPAAPGYVVYPGYGAPGPVACPGGYWARRPIAFDAYGNPVRWSHPRFICP
jgi:hypothetical protein